MEVVEQRAYETFGERGVSSTSQRNNVRPSPRVPVSGGDAPLVTV